jgi:ABC transporter with metal-binding/Fe-S-binding domain ATP-binding protein
MKLALLLSGGKDSLLAYQKACEEHEVVCLISLISKNKESYMFHVPNIHITKYQAQAMDLPIIEKITPGEKEVELAQLQEAILQAKEEYQIQGIVSGAIKSTYQASRIEKICKDLDLWNFNPVWLTPQLDVLEQIQKNNFKTIISGVFAYPFDKSFLGKVIDENMIKKLKEFGEKYQINEAGEGGEIETTVLDAPFFKKEIVVTKSNIEYDNYAGTFFIESCELEDKN